MSNLITIFGYGSLMTYQSVLMTMPHALNHRFATLYDYERVFDLVSISGIRTQKANLDTLEMAALSIRPQKHARVHGVCFDIPEEELAAYKEREHRYVVKEVLVEEDLSVSDSNAEKRDNNDKSTTMTTAYTVVQNTDENYFREMPPSEKYERVEQYYDSSLWSRTDIFPLRQYLINCVIAANAIDELLETCENKAKEGEGNASNTETTNSSNSTAVRQRIVLRNLMDECFLADGSTTIRQYMKSNAERFPDDIISDCVNDKSMNINSRSML